MITKTEEHETNRAGKRLLREVIEPLGWVVNDVQEDYGIDCNIQIFDEKKAPTGAWFHVQLKSSASSAYSAGHTFISQELSIDHARHYALEMRDPVFVIHADVTANTLYWYAPQLHRELTTGLEKTTAQSITVRIPTHQQLPATAAGLLESLEKIYLALASREIISASSQSFAETLKHMPDQEELHRGFQIKADTLRLQRVASLFAEKKFDEARPRAVAVLADPDSVIEIKFWAQIQLQGIDYGLTLHAGKPQKELHEVILAHTKALQKLAASGTNPMKLYALIARQAAELEVLVHENFSLSMALRQHLEERGNPLIALSIHARRSVLTKRITYQYNRCVRLAQFAANYPDRWMVGRALSNIVNAVAPYIITLQSDGNLEAEQAFARSALQVCKLAVWIGNEVGDSDAVAVAILSSLLTTQTEDSDAYRWATEVAQTLSDPEDRADILERIERAVKRWKGERVEGDYHGDTLWQVTQNIATALGIDLTDEKDPLVSLLKIAVKDDTPERVLARCGHIVVSRGATGPTARRIQRLFNIGTAGCKVVHCLLHDYHVEGKELDAAYEEFKRKHCDSCQDQEPRPADWSYTDEIRRAHDARTYEFINRLDGTPHGFRHTTED